MSALCQKRTSYEARAMSALQRGAVIHHLCDLIQSKKALLLAVVLGGYVLLAPLEGAALFIRRAPVQSSSLHTARFSNHVAMFSCCASCGKIGNARQPFAAFQSAGAGSTCRTLRCFQYMKLEKGRSWSLARPIYIAQLSTTRLFERAASYMFAEIFSAI